MDDKTHDTLESRQAKINSRIDEEVRKRETGETPAPEPQLSPEDQSWLFRKMIESELAVHEAEVRARLRSDPGEQLVSTVKDLWSIGSVLFGRGGGER